MFVFDAKKIFISGCDPHSIDTNIVKCAGEFERRKFQEWLHSLGITLHDGKSYKDFYPYFDTTGVVYYDPSAGRMFDERKLQFLIKQSMERGYKINIHTMKELFLYELPVFVNLTNDEKFEKRMFKMTTMLHNCQDHDPALVKIKDLASRLNISVERLVERLCSVGNFEELKKEFEK